MNQLNQYEIACAIKTVSSDYSKEMAIVNSIRVDEVKFKEKLHWKSCCLAAAVVMIAITSISVFRYSVSKTELLTAIESPMGTSVASIVNDDSSTKADPPATEHWLATAIELNSESQSKHRVTVSKFPTSSMNCQDHRHTIHVSNATKRRSIPLHVIISYEDSQSGTNRFWEDAGTVWYFLQNPIEGLKMGGPLNSGSPICRQSFDDFYSPIQENATLSGASGS